jgi:N-acetyl-anhydromuramyl-L-alanine amidase AmpD
MARTKTEPPAHTTHIVRNQSSRNGRTVSAVAVHSTESQDIPGSTDDLVAIRNWFDNPASQASSHIGIDGAGNTEVWVHSDRKAWTILDLNSVTCNIEFIGRAAQPASAWEESQIKQGARWAAYWCLMFDIPAQRGVVRNVAGNAVVTKKGIITHKQLTDAGFGSHVDPGPQFPMQDFLRYTRYFKQNGWVV